MKSSIKIIYWTPRLLGIAAILFISVFALDAFGHDKSIWAELVDFAIHLIPSIFLLIILLIAWRKELVGGIIFTAIGVLMTPVVYLNNFKQNQSVEMSLGIIGAITIPFVLIGILFILSHFKKK